MGTSLDALVAELQRVEDAYRGNLRLEKSVDFEDRAAQATVFFELKMWEAAATALYGVVLPSQKSNPGYAEALYQLAESLFQLRNYGSAGVYFGELVRRPETTHRRVAMERLVAIADITADYASLDRHYRSYLEQAGGRAPSDILYLRGKSLFLVGRANEAVTSLEAISAGDEYYLRAQYLIAAGHVRENDLEGALEAFTAVSALTPVVQNDKAVIELAHIARGRLLYELDRLAEAIDAYQYVSWDSEHLVTMLYEVTWTYVRRGHLLMTDTSLSDEERRSRLRQEYDLALRQLEDLTALEGSDTSSGADITLLLGSLRLQQGSFDEAQQVFQRVLGQYQGADQRLELLLAQPTLRDRIVQDLLAMENGALSVESELPAIAARRAAANAEVSKSVRVFRELHTSRQELEATQELLDTIDGVLVAGNRSELFPELYEGLSRGLSVMSNALLARSELADARHATLPERGGGDFDTLEELRARRVGLARKVAALPTSAASFDQRVSAFDAGFDQLGRGLHEVRLQLQAMRQQLVALDEIYSAGAERRDVVTERRIRDFLSLVEGFESQGTAIAADLEAARMGTTLSGDRDATEGDLRRLLRIVLDEESALLAKVESTQAGVKYRELDVRAREIDARSEKFLNSLQAVVDTHIARLQRLVDEERATVRGYADALEAVDRSAVAVRDALTRTTLEHVRSELHEIVVRADVGLIDTAFARKQVETEKIGRLQRQKAAELTDLNQAYADLTRDEVAD
ncbi:MAG: hypothetical protein ACO3JL_03020 [Myxococcota bacterium]